MQIQETWGRKYHLVELTFGLNIQPKVENRFLNSDGVFLEVRPWGDNTCIISKGY